MEIVTSNLGEVTRELQRVRMLCYTINLSPKYWCNGGLWGDKSPIEQQQYLKRVHRTLYLRMYKYLDNNDEVNNTVSFEFTKAGEVHSHGYFNLEDKYGGYDRYKYLLLKFARAALMLPRNMNHALFIRWADDPDKWIEYITKDIEVSGYKPYIADIESETKVISILDFIK